MHASVIAYAVPRHFRLMRDDQGRYWLLNGHSEKIDCPATGETTAAGALRMMRRHIRQGRTDARAEVFEFEAADLAKLGELTIVETGEENVYFVTADGTRGFAKV